MVMKAQRDEGSGKILLDNNIGYEVVTLQLIMFCVFKFEFEVDFLVMHTKI